MSKEELAKTFGDTMYQFFNALSMTYDNCGDCKNLVEMFVAYRKKDDNFEVFRAALDYINTEKLSTNISKRLIAYASFFDRRWWRETDMFVNAELDSATGDVTLESSPKGWYFANVPGYNLVRTGNRNDNFGILRTFYVLGLENSYQINHNIFSLPSKMELGWRVYWERFIDDRKTGFVAVYDSTTGLVDSVFAPDARDGVYFRGAGEDLEILGTSHHYETLALSGFFSESIEQEREERKKNLKVIK